jgi:hypothetical protein
MGIQFWQNSVALLNQNLVEIVDLSIGRRDLNAQRVWHTVIEANFTNGGNQFHDVLGIET